MLRSAPFVTGEHGKLGHGAVCQGVGKDTAISVRAIFLRSERRHQFLVQSAVREAESGAQVREAFFRAIL